MAFSSKIFGKYLLVTNTVSCGAMMALGDVLQQRGDDWRYRFLRCFKSEVHAKESALELDMPESNEKIANVPHDFARTKNMLMVGLLQGPFHHYFYTILDRVLPGKSAKTIMKKTFLDQLIATPTCLGIFFFGLGTLEQRKLSDINAEVKLKLFDTWKVDCCFWPPTQIINFLFVPIHYRVVYINLMTMFYDMFLSYMKYEAHID